MRRSVGSNRSAHLLGLGFIGAGVAHFVRPDIYEAIMPRWFRVGWRWTDRPGSLKCFSVPACCSVGRDRGLLEVSSGCWYSYFRRISTWPSRRWGSDAEKMDD